MPRDKVQTLLRPSFVRALAGASLMLLSLAGARRAAADSGVSDERVSLPDGPGSIGGVGENAEVSPGMGATRYQIPIDLPEGFRMMTPSLTLSYSSTAGSSEVGIGWELPVPHIERMSLRGLPTYGEDDEFAYAGSSELVRVGERDGAAIYRARFEGGFVRYAWHEVGDGAAGYWTAEWPDGTKSWFGADPSGALVDEAVVTNGVGSVFRYMIVATVDPFGHVVRFGYDKPDEWPLLSSVHYVTDDAGNPRFSARLSYEPRPDVISTCVPGFELRLAHRLSRIEVRSRSQVIRSYELGYEGGATSGGFSRLTTVEQLGFEGAPSPIRFAFEYSRVLGDRCSGPDCQSPRIIDMGTLPGGVDLTTGRATLLDIDGDALPDMLSSELDGSHTFHIARIGEDGNPRFLPPRESAATEGGSSFVLGAPGVQVLDVNGDGFTDIVSSRAGEVLCNDGSGDWNGASCAMNGTLPQLETDDEPGDQNPLYARFFDYDNDKRIDLLQTLDGATLVYKNDGEAFVQEAVDELGARFDVGDNTLQLADMNGDGLQDPVELPPGGKLRYRLNLGFGRWTPWVDLDIAGLSDALRPFASLEDLDGDGLADLVIVAGNEVRYARNRSAGSFDPFVTLTEDDIDGELPERAATTIVLFADMNGSGSDDVVWVDGGRVRFLELFPVKPNLLARIENGLGSVQRFRYASSVLEQARDLEDAPWPHRLPHAMNVVIESDRWVTLTGSEDGSGLHETTAYRYHDGFYDGSEKAFRGYARVEQLDGADTAQDGQEPGWVEYLFDSGASDPYRNGLLLRRSVLGGSAERPVPIVEERVAYEDCPLAGVPDANELRLPVRFVCAVSRVKVLQEGAPEEQWATLRTDFRYDGYGHVIETDELGVVHMGPPEAPEGCAPCDRPDDGFGAPCGAACSGDERFERTSYVQPGADSGGLWILGMPVRSTQSASESGPASETRSYYDGEPFEGLPAGELTFGLPTRVERRVSGDHFVQSRRVRFDAHGQAVEQLDPLGDPAEPDEHRRRYVYDATGLNAVRVEVATTSPRGEPYVLRRDMAYDELWNEVTESTGWIAVQGGKALTARQSSYYRYDALGRLERIVREGDTTEAPSERYTYDLGEPYSTIGVHRRSEAGGDEDLEQLRCLDGLGREFQRRTRLSSGAYWVDGFVAYNSRGQVVRRYQPYESESAACDREPPEGVAFTASKLDAAGRLIEVTSPDEALYGSASRLRVEYAPLAVRRFDAEDNDDDGRHKGTPATERRDGLDRLVALERDLGEAEPVITTVRYDALGHVAAVLDSSGNVHRQRYDLVGRAIELDGPNSGLTRIAYDDAGNEIEREDAQGQRVLTRYDGINRILSRYDAADREATESAWEHDFSEACDECAQAAGRIARVTYPLGRFGRGEDRFAYDARGRMTTSTRRLEGVSLTTRLEYDDADRLVRTTLPDGTELAYGWDAGDRLTSVEGLVDAVRYDERGLVAGIALHNGVDVRSTFDVRMRLEQSEVIGPGDERLQSLRFTRDRAGNTLAIEDEGDEREGRLPRGARYAYDALYRLTEAELERDRADAELIAHSYDRLDNLLSVHSSEGPGSPGHVGDFAYDDARPNAVVAAGSLAYAYDDAGRMIERGDRLLSWDYRGRLIGAEREAARTELFYGADERRVIKAEHGGVVHYVSGDFEIRDGISTSFVNVGGDRVARVRSAALATELMDDLAPEGDPDGAITAADAWLAEDDEAALRMLRSSARRVLLEAGPAVAYLHHDELGNTTLSTGPDGEVLGERSYYPTGATRAEHGYLGEHGFGGKELDDGTGLYDFGARALDATAGRWASPDPLFALLDAENVLRAGEATSAYAYAANGFGSAIDPSGLEKQKPKGGKGATAKPKAGKKSKGAAFKKFLKKNGAGLLAAATGLTAAIVGATTETDSDADDYNAAADYAVQALGALSAGAWVAGEIANTVGSVRKAKRTGKELSKRDIAQMGAGIAAGAAGVVGASATIAGNFTEGDTAEQVAGYANLAAGGLWLAQEGIGATKAFKKDGTAKDRAKSVVGLGGAALCTVSAGLALWGGDDAADATTGTGLASGSLWMISAAIP